VNVWIIYGSTRCACQEEEEEGEQRKTPDLQWRGPKDDDLAKRKGWTKLLFGIIAGASEIESLCTEENINRAIVPLEADVLELEFREGMTPLDVAMRYLAPVHVVTTLLKHGAKSSSTLEEWLSKCPARSLSEHARRFSGGRMNTKLLFSSGDRDKSLLPSDDDDDEITEELLNVVIRNDGSDYELIRHVLSCLSKRADVAVVKPQQNNLWSSWTNKFVRDPRVLLRGGNALHVACSIGDVRTVQMLLDSGRFDVTRRTRIGQASALDIAKRFGGGARLYKLLTKENDDTDSNRSSTWLCFW
jgi:ankyrin repeat protein